MEIREIVTYYLNPTSNILEVSFRSIEDNEDIIRTDNIDYGLVQEYGYDLETEGFDFFGDEIDEFEFEDTIEKELDEYELISFMNDYYTVNPDLFPKSQTY